MKNFSKQEKNLLIIQSVDTFLSSMAGIFFTVFLFVNSDLKTTILYNLIVYINLLIWYILSGVTFKKISSQTIIKFCLFCSSIFYFSLFLLKDKAIAYIFPLATLSGFIAGNYWAAFNLNQYINTKQEKRIKYFGTVNLLYNISHAFGPFLGGYIITVGNKYLDFFNRSGYMLLFLIISLMLFLLSVFVGKLPKHEKIQFSYKTLLTHKRTPSWKSVLLQQFSLGFYDVSLGTILTILVFEIVRKEIVIGGIQTIYYILGSLGALIATFLLQKNKNFYWLGSIGLFLGITLFAFNQNLTGIIFLITITGLTKALLETWLSSVYLNTMDTYQENWSNKYHLLLERDTSLGLARILSYTLLFLFLSHNDQLFLAQKWLFLLALIPIILGFLLKNIKTENKYSVT